MNTIKELLSILPEIIIYLVTGFVFIKTFHFVALKQNTTDVEHILTSSIVIGYIYCKLASFIPFSISYEVDTIIIIVSALVMGYLIAKALRCKYIIEILDFLKIRDTGNLYFWDDIMDDKYPMKLSIEYNNVTYNGMLHNYESYSNDPHIVLCSYVAKDQNDNIIEDFSNDNTRIIMLDSAKASKINVIYYKDSDECVDLQKLCDFNTKRFNENIE